jgi:hypothetical protein
LGDGQLGLLALTVSPAIYNTLSAVVFVPPANPGPLPAFPARATGEQQANLVRRHAATTALFREYRATDNALKQQIIGCIDKIFLRTLSDRITGYARVTTRAMLIHLYKSYGRLSADDVVENDKSMKEPYDPNQPIEAFIAQIEDAIALADAADAAYTQAQIVLIAYNLIFQTGMFPEACREWRRRPTVEKTWVNFKTEMVLSHEEFRASQVTSNQAGYQSANNVSPDQAYDIQHETATAIANLATATAADRSTLASLTSSNSSLSTELTQATAKLSAATIEISLLRAQLENRAETGRRRPGRPPDEGRRPPFAPNTNYCWTHGYKVAKTHKSSTCNSRATGHKQDATRDNNMGGSQANKE